MPKIGWRQRRERYTNLGVSSDYNRIWYWDILSTNAILSMIKHKKSWSITFRLSTGERTPVDKEIGGKEAPYRLQTRSVGKSIVET